MAALAGMEDQVKRALGLILALLGISISVGLAIYVYIQADQVSKVTRQATTDVVVAREDLAPRVAVPASAVAVVKMPVDLVPPEAATSAADVVGRYPLTKIYRGETLIRPELADTEGQTGPAFMLRDDSVAVTYPGSDLLTSAGAVRAGDRVDLLISLPVSQPAQPTAAAPADGATPIVTQMMLQNIEVLRVGSFTAPGQQQANASSKFITFQVKPQDALVLKWAKDSGGTIDLVLRPPSRREEDVLEAVNSSYISRRFRVLLTEPQR